ncbi:MAG: C45 family autoproteolytic acyltransferase/hydrolase [Bryobacteraceae bacterium]
MLRLLFALLAAGFLQAGTPLFRSSVERGRSDWTAERGSLAIDTTVLHDNYKSLRVEAGSAGEASVRSAPVSLRIGKSYELSGWARTENLQVRDVDRSRIATGAVLTMASMPFDVHSVSLAGTRPWTRLTLRFVASRAEDRILLSVGNGGESQGRAWFEGITLDEVSGVGDPAADAIRTFGPAYRYPASGWIYLHIEGGPYERGYQHGHLMAREIPEYLERCAALLGAKAEEQSWGALRTTADALFLRGFDREILEEMKGIAEGASDAGAKWLGRRIDVVDIVVANTTVEMGELGGAMPMTPTGLEGLRLEPPKYFDRKRDSVLDHCSAFAATGKATRDGKMVIGHVTWWPLTLAEQTNVMLDIQPAQGHRMLMQSYPGGIESGTDWYQNDAGMVLTETTIRQTPFNPQGTPVAFRARNAIQYGGNVDEIVARLGTRNNGLYTNEWLIGDGKNNEIAMYELGTNRTKLWRSSKDEWFGGTEGFYWGNNNAKDLGVRLEYLPDPQGAPEYVPYVPRIRDQAWKDLYAKYRGQIDEQFGFLAYRGAPLVSSSTMDAKITTSEMAQNLMLWAAIGKPNQRVWEPSEREKNEYTKNNGLYPSGYRLFHGAQSEALRSAIQAKETARTAAPSVSPEIEAKPKEGKPAEKAAYAERLWKGWILPASDADTWLAAGTAAYHQDLQSDDLEKQIETRRAMCRRLRLSASAPEERYLLEESKGVLFLDVLRRRLGDDAFLKLMHDYFTANTTRTVTAQSFLEKTGVPFSIEAGEGAAYLTVDILRRLRTALLVYGTMQDAGANRYAAEQMQKEMLNWYESEVPIRKDFEVSDDELRARDVIFIGRPEANSALAAWAERLHLDYQQDVFRIGGKTYAGERDALVFAGKNPLDETRMALVVAGNDALHTVKLAMALGDWKPGEYLLSQEGKPLAAGFVKP